MAPFERFVRERRKIEPRLIARQKPIADEDPDSALKELVRAIGGEKSVEAIWPPKKIDKAE